MYRSGAKGRAAQGKIVNWRKIATTLINRPGPEERMDFSRRDPAHRLRPRIRAIMHAKERIAP